MAENLLNNGSFEADWGEEGSHRVLVVPTEGPGYETELGEIRTPPRWLSWYHLDPGNWDRPEIGAVRSEHEPYRVREGKRAIRLFTFYRKHDAGLLQKVEVEPGQKLRLTAWAHAWSNHPLEGHEGCAEDPRCSAGVGTAAVSLRREDIPPLTGDPWNDAVGNISFMLGIDPQGGIDPFADTVVWGPAACIYNSYDQVPPVEARAEAETVTVFLRSQTMWAFKHNDVYWDAVELVAVREAPEPEPKPAPEPVPAPESVPLEWTYHVTREGSKVGVHAIYSNRVSAFCSQLATSGTRFPVVKGVDDLQWVSEVKAVDPDVITIGRYTSPYEGCGALDSSDADIDALADALLDVITSKVDAEVLDAVDYWEIVNEPDPPGPEGYRRLAELMKACMERAEAEDLKLALFSLNSGTPEYDEMEAIVESGVFAAAKKGGHILALHEGTFGRDQDPKMGWGKPIPGAPEIEDAGELNCRYRYLYRLLQARDQVVPLVVSEWYAGNEEGTPVDHLLSAAKWYDAQVRRDHYVWAFCPFTLGPTGAWAHTDWEPVYPDLLEHMVASKDQQNALPPGEESEPPRPTECVPLGAPYHRSYVLLPPIRDPVERLDWRTAVALGTSETLETVAHTAVDAGVAPPADRVTVINPSQHKETMRDWYQAHYPGTMYRELEVPSPWDLAVRLLPNLEEDIAVGQNDPRWQSYDFGEEPGGETLGGYGSLLTSLTILLRNIYGRRITPPHLDKLLVAARAAFIDDNVLIWDETVALFSAFDGSIADENRRSVDELEALWNQGWEIILRLVDEQGTPSERFVYLERIIDDGLQIIDPRDGTRKQKTAEEYAPSLQGIRAAHLRRMPSTPLFQPLAVDGEDEEGVPPSEPYERTCVLLPQIEDLRERLEWRMAAAIGSSEATHAFGHATDGAGGGPPDRCIVAVNPTAWGSDLEAWYHEHSENPAVERVDAETPWAMAVKLMPVLGEDIALAQNDDRWADYDFGEHPDVGGETIGRYGCFLTGLSIILRKIYQRDVIPPVLDKLLVAARSGYVRDNYMAWSGVVSMFPAFDEGIKDFEHHPASELKQMLAQNWEIILRRAVGEHFVYLEDVEGDRLIIIDTWDGKRKEKTPVDYRGVRAVHVKAWATAPRVEVLLGLHDDAGGEWMRDQGVVGCCLVHRQVQNQPIHLDFRHLQQAGIVVIGRLNWGYADGSGTLPRPEQRGAFVDAVAETMLGSQGIDFFHVGNEPNNRQEWPGFGSPDEFPLTQEYVTQIYNDIWHRVSGRVRLGPPPIDPYFGPQSNNRDWWTYILDNAAGADALFLHSKTQTNDPNEVWSRAKFSDWPLQWQYLHLRTIETSLEVVPSRLRDLPVFVTELNPQNLREGGGIGWQPGNDAWVREAVRYFREEQPVTGVVFYRYKAAGDQAPFGLENRPAILAAIEDAAAFMDDPMRVCEGGVPCGLAQEIWARVIEAAA